MSNDDFNEVLKAYQRAIDQSRGQDFDVYDGFTDARESSKKARLGNYYGTDFSGGYSLGEHDSDWLYDRIYQKKQQLENERLSDENILRNKLGHTAIRFVWLQLSMSNLGFATYVVYSIYKGWNIPNEVIIGWMSSSLIEIIGILWVIARSLFPFRDMNRDEKAEKSFFSRGTKK